MSGSHLSTRQVQRRRDIAYAVGVLLGLTAFTLVVLWLQGLTHDLRDANAARDALARQVQQLGAKPVAGPPGSRGEPGVSVTGPRGQQGETGPQGPAGPTGDPGTKGKPGAKGSDGEPGTDATGAPGPEGPAGPQGEPGPAGPAGPPGANGKDGTDGADGRDGQTCPDGYSFQPLPADPDALVCRRDAPANNDAGDSPPQAAGLDPQRRQYP